MGKIKIGYKNKCSADSFKRVFRIANQ